MINDDCDRTAALAAGWALGALDPEDMAFVRSHLETCRRPHAELREAAAIAAAIGAALPDQEIPPAALRGRVLAAARRPAATATIGSAGEPMRRGWRWAAFGATALALAASLTLAVQIGENRALRDQVADLAARVTAATAERQQAEGWIERAVARGADAFFMTGQGEGRSASFMLVVEHDATGAVLLMSGLPALTTGETYELWVERDGEVTAVQAFRPDAGGLAAVTIDGSLAGVRQAMITVEPGAGSSAPSLGDVIMQGELSL